MPRGGPDRYALFGHPVSHSWSPFIHGLFARQFGHDIEYKLVDVERADFRRAVIDFFVDHGKGLNVTLPHKQAAAEVVNELTPRAARAGAVNTIVARDAMQLLGDNTDGAGLITDLVDNLGVSLEGSRILVLGAGGAVRGVLAPLLRCRPEELRIANRTRERAEGLAQEFGDLGNITISGFADAGGGWNLVINATSASLSGQMPVLPVAAVAPGTVCYDMAYGRAETPFLAWASRLGATRCHKGWGMLVEQAAEAYLLWRGVRPETRSVIEALAGG
ncbi:MAG: shikimate dehydrogenase [Steroidobacteraceae bacterium]|jgi:shikimate dehydrogenase|nr:shikimate dehydrogenase [Steroidobacteraceae bacterium]